MEVLPELGKERYEPELNRTPQPDEPIPTSQAPAADQQQSQSTTGETKTEGAPDQGSNGDNESQQNGSSPTSSEPGTTGSDAGSTGDAGSITPAPVAQAPVRDPLPFQVFNASNFLEAEVATEDEARKLAKDVGGTYKTK